VGFIVGILMKLVNQFINASVAGFISVLIGFASSIALIYQCVINLGGNSDLVASWIFALGICLAFTSALLSLTYRIPILIAWSTPGVALLIASVQGFNLNEAIGAFMVSGLLIFLSGASGLFAKLMNKIPLQLASAMLAGLLVNFTINLFNQANTQPLLILLMFITYLISNRLFARYSMLFVLIIAISTLALFADMTFPTTFTATELVFIQPTFNVASITSIALPLFIITMLSQNLPGLSVLKVHQYDTPTSAILTITGLVNCIAAPFGVYAINLAAITAAICMSDTVHKQAKQRYWAVVMASVFYLLMGLLAGSLMVLFDDLPSEFIIGLAGIALINTVKSSLYEVMKTSCVISEASFVTFLISASNINVLGINSLLWGLLAGGLILTINKLKNRSDNSIKNRLT